MKTRSNILAITAAVLSNVLWGSTFLGSKQVLAVCPPFTAVLVRFSVALVALGSLALLQRRNLQWEVVRRRALTLILLGAIGYTGCYLFQMWALQWVTSSQSAAIMLLAPIFTLLTTIAITRRANLMEGIATLVCFAGAGVILFDQARIDFSGLGMTGLLLTLLSAVCLGVSVLLTKQLLAPDAHGPGLGVGNLTLYSLILGWIGFLPLAAIEIAQTSQWHLNESFWLWSLYLGLVCSVIAFLLWNWSIQSISPVAAAIAMYLKTPVALLLGSLKLGEQLSATFYFGTALILVSVFTNHLWKTGRAK